MHRSSCFGLLASIVWIFMAWGTDCAHSQPSVVGAEQSLTPSSRPLVVVVMDPLSDKLACDCVEGYAQRKYEVLGHDLQRRLSRPVEVYWGESIAAALKDQNAQREVPLAADLVIGKHSVVATESQQRSLRLQPVAQLTGKDGSTQQWGLVVVRGTDPALVVDDLEGYQIIFGPANCDEKYAAPRQLLLEADIALPAEVVIAEACSLAAKQMLACPPEEKIAAIISSYAAPLLEGCGTVNKGDLRVIGQSQPVPFITAFVSESVEEPTRSQLLECLLTVAEDTTLRSALETAKGFVPYQIADVASADVHSEKKTK